MVPVICNLEMELPNNRILAIGATLLSQIVIVR